MSSVELNATVDGNGEKNENSNEPVYTPIIPMSTARLKEKYKKLYEIAVTVDEDDESEGRKIAFLFTQPSAASFNRYIKTASKNMVSATAIFVRDNIIEEQVADLEKECNAYPGLALNMGQRLLSVLGLGDNVNFKRI